MLATMRLFEQGKLDIDRPLQDYLSEFSIKSRFVNNYPITARTIMTHHSGIPHDYYKDWTSEVPYTELVQNLQNEYANYPPNYVFAYSNAAFSILGHTIAKVSGKEYADYIRDELLSPCGMQDSFITNFPPVDAPLFSKSYKKGKSEILYPLRDIPAGGLCSNVLDMVCFLKMLFAGGSIDGHRIIKPENIIETLKPQNEKLP